MRFKFLCFSTCTVLKPRNILIDLYGYNDLYTNMKLLPKSTTIEHVVPKSRLPKTAIWDLNNLVLIDKDLNQFRGNTKFGTKTIKAVSFCPKFNKGHVSRICAHMFEKYPNTNTKLVIDKKTLLLWNEMYPVTDFEKYVNEYIFNVQGTFNRFTEDDINIFDRI